MVLVVFAYWFWRFVVGPLGLSLPFPLISIRRATGLGCFGCFCLVVSVVFGRVLREPPTMSVDFHQICSLLVVFVVVVVFA